MKVFKIIIKWIAITLLSFITFNLFISSEYSIKRSVEIKNVSDFNVIYNHIIDLSNWRDWAIWFQSDATLEVKITEPLSGKGSKIEWDGVNSLEIMHADSLSYDGKTRIKIHFQFDNMRSSQYLELDVKDNFVIVNWHIKGKSPYFYMNFTTLLMDQILGSSMQESLNNLRILIEKDN